MNLYPMIEYDELVDECKNYVSEKVLKSNYKNTLRLNNFIQKTKFLFLVEGHDYIFENIGVHCTVDNLNVGKCYPMYKIIIINKTIFHTMDVDKKKIVLIHELLHILEHELGFYLEAMFDSHGIHFKTICKELNIDNVYSNESIKTT